MDTARLLIEIISDKKADWADKQDAIFDLSSYTDVFVINALKIFILSEEDEMLRRDAVETLLSIWIKLNQFDLDYFKILPGHFQDDIIKITGYDKPEWINIFEKFREKPSNSVTKQLENETELL